MNLTQFWMLSCDLSVKEVLWDVVWTCILPLLNVLANRPVTDNVSEVCATVQRRKGIRDFRKANHAIAVPAEMKKKTMLQKLYWLQRQTEKNRPRQQLVLLPVTPKCPVERNTPENNRLISFNDFREDRRLWQNGVFGQVATGWLPCA